MAFDFHSQLVSRFEAALADKTGWGRNELRTVFLGVYADVCLLQATVGVIGRVEALALRDIRLAFVSQLADGNTNIGRNQAVTLLRSVITLTVCEVGA